MKSFSEFGSEIRIGNQTSCSAGGDLPFNYAVEHDFTAFEWFSDRGSGGWCEANSDSARREDLRRTGIDHDISFSVHAPFAGDPLTSAGHTAIRESIEFAADIQAQSVNLHLFADHDPDVFADAVANLLGLAKDANIVLTLENTPLTSPDHFNSVFGTLSTIPEAKGRVGMCFDSGHANLYAETRNDYIRYLDRLDVQIPILAWHAHENWGDRDSHLTLFTGPSRHDPSGLQTLVERLVRRQFCGSIILEQWPTPPDLLLAAADGLRRMFETAQVSVSIS